MSQHTKIELVKRWRPKYQREDKLYKSRLLNEFCELTRLHAVPVIIMMDAPTAGLSGRSEQPPVHCILLITAGS